MQTMTVSLLPGDLDPEPSRVWFTVYGDYVEVDRIEQRDQRGRWTEYTCTEATRQLIETAVHTNGWS